MYQLVTHKINNQLTKSLKMMNGRYGMHQSFHTEINAKILK